VPRLRLAAPIRTRISGGVGASGVSIGAISAITMTGPTSGTVSVASTPFTISANGPVGTSIVVTMSDAANGGTFTPTTVTLTTGSPSQTFTYTPASVGAKTISVTNVLGLTPPGNITYTSNAAGSALTTFTVSTAATPATLPFVMGIALKKSDATSIATDLTNYQVTIKRIWNDGSIKHAIIAGRKSLSSSPSTVTVSSGSAQGGTALTSSSIQTAAPTASIQCGSLGTVNLSSLLASPFRTWISGHEMVECHYRANVGTGDLSAWFHVRLFADNRVWVRCIVENGYLDNGSGSLANTSTQTYVPTITVGGVTVYNNGGASLSHYGNTRYMAEGWIGGDPQVTPLVDVTYLRSTKLVTNVTTAPSSSVLSALLQTYTPMGGGSHDAVMSDPGYHQDIGLLPHWNAAFVGSGDARAFKATLVNSSALNSYGIVWRSKITQETIKPNSYSTWNALATLGGGGLGAAEPTRGSLAWDGAHFPNDGYLAYLLTGDYWHYETMTLQASLCYLSLSSNRGNGTSRKFDNGQMRGRAWLLRSCGSFGAIAPDSDAIAAEYQSLLSYNYGIDAAQLATPGVNANMVNAGVLYSSQHYGLWDTVSQGGAVVGSMAPWMTAFYVATNGFISDIEPLSSMTQQNSVRDHWYKWAVGMFGVSGDVNSYSFTGAAEYGYKPASANEDYNWYSSFGGIWTASVGSSNSTPSNTLTGGNISIYGGMHSYWGNTIGALMYAVDHAATGAAAAYTRLTGATNWSTLTSNFSGFPEWAIATRNPPSVPSWLGAVNIWSAAPSSVLTSSGVGWSGTPPGGGDYTNVVSAWCSGVLNQTGLNSRGTYIAGPHLVIWGGGHTNYGGNELYAYGPFDSSTPIWRRISDPTIPAPRNVARNGSGYPVSRHTYDGIEYVSSLNKMLSVGVGSRYDDGYSDTSSDLYDFSVNSTVANPWSSNDSGSPSQDNISVMCAADETTGYVWGLGCGNSRKLFRWIPATATWTTWDIDNPNYELYCKAAIDPVHKILVFGGASNTIKGVDLRTPTASVYTIATTGSGPGSSTLTLQWDSIGGRFVAWNQSGRTIYFLTPSASPYSGGTAWTWTSNTPSTGATPVSTVRGAYGRFRLVTGVGWRGLVLMSTEDSSICVYRLS
jgi:hypothetical protein